MVTPLPPPPSSPGPSGDVAEWKAHLADVHAFYQQHDQQRSAEFIAHNDDMCKEVATLLRNMNDHLQVQSKTAFEQVVSQLDLARGSLSKAANAVQTVKEIIGDVSEL